VLVFVENWGPTGLWVAVALGDIVGCLVAVAWFTRGTWKRSVVRETGPTTPGLADD